MVAVFDSTFPGADRDGTNDNAESVPQGGSGIHDGGGELGETINSGLKLDRNPAILIGAVLVAILALVFDFLSAVAQRYLKPKGM